MARPGPQSRPLEALSGLWGGELPEFETMEAANALIGALAGLWNRLSGHRERSAPFRLARLKLPSTREGVATLALVRREELDGFIDGLFRGNESLELPERADKALRELREIRAIVQKVHELAGDRDDPAAPAEIARLLGRHRDFTRAAEHEMHEAVLSCTRVRRQMLRTMTATKPAPP